MKNEKDMIKWLNNLKSDIGQQQHSQLWHYAEILDVIIKYLESTERTGEWVEEVNDEGEFIRSWHCSNCYYSTGFYTTMISDFCPKCGADMRGDK